MGDERGNAHPRGLIVEEWGVKLKTVKGSHMKGNVGQYKCTKSGSGVLQDSSNVVAIDVVNI